MKAESRHMLEVHLTVSCPYTRSVFSDARRVVRSAACSQMAFSGNGDVFVADGYCNRRVMQYTADGTFIRAYTMANVRTHPFCCCSSVKP